MHRSAAILLLALVLGAFVAASADDGKNNYDYNHEPREKRCHLRKPWRYNTWGCPECKRDHGCITSVCNNPRDGKADVTIDLKCLFGDKVKFVAVSYGNVCVNNQEGYMFSDKIYLNDLDCHNLPKLRFIVQDKWWFNKDGYDLDISDSCYDKCTKGKPCHTCVFKDIVIPPCYCDPLCPRKDYNCPVMLGKECFKFEPYYDFVKVTLLKRCRKGNSHVVFSYTNPRGYKDCTDHTCGGYNDWFSFKAACKSSFKWFLEDPYFLNTKAPMGPIMKDDKCYGKFDDKHVCDQCGPFGPVDVGYCKRKHDYDHKHHN